MVGFVIQYEVKSPEHTVETCPFKLFLNKQNKLAFSRCLGLTKGFTGEACFAIIIYCAKFLPSALAVEALC